MNAYNIGLLHEPVVIGKDGILGSATSYAGKTVVRPDGKWEVHKINESHQANDHVDTFSCVSFGNSNQEEVYKLNRYGIQTDHSDRFLARVSDTQPNGNSPQKVYEARRNNGYLFEMEWPFAGVTTWLQWMADIPSNLLTLASGRSAEWLYWHDYVSTSHASIREALKFSPVAFSVPAWFKDINGLYYRPDGIRDGHWTLCVGMFENGDYDILDTYPDENGSYRKRMRADFIPEVAKVIEIDRQVANETLWTKFLVWLHRSVFNV